MDEVSWVPEKSLLDLRRSSVSILLMFKLLDSESLYKLIEKKLYVNNRIILAIF